MNNEDWNLEKQEICEGFDHPDAKPLDAETLPLAAEQLRISLRDNQVSGQSLFFPGTLKDQCHSV